VRADLPRFTSKRLTFFAEAERHGFRGIIGKAMMDRNAPDALLEKP
jgi:hypothetical protein